MKWKNNTVQGSVFQPFLWSGTLSSNFDCSQNPWCSQL